MSLLKELMSTHRSLADTILEPDLLQLILEDDPDPSNYSLLGSRLSCDQSYLKRVESSGRRTSQHLTCCSISSSYCLLAWCTLEISPCTPQGSYNNMQASWKAAEDTMSCKIPLLNSCRLLYGFSFSATNHSV